MSGFIIIVLLNACGTRPQNAQDDIQEARQVVSQAESTGCAHDSLDLAKKYQKEADQYYQKGEYQKAQVKARVAKQYAQEVILHNQNTPCRVEEVVPQDEKQDYDTTELDDDSKNSNQDQLATIYFKYDSSKLGSEAIQVLEDHIKTLRNHPSWRVRVVGHCDSRGNSGYNLALSERRAVMVEGYLKKAGINESNLEAVGYGSEDLATTRADAQGHALNRRVVFEVTP